MKKRPTKKKRHPVVQYLSAEEYAKEIAKETVEDVIGNVEVDLVQEWAEQEAHRQALINCDLSYLEELAISYELSSRYWEDEEKSAIRAFHSWLQRYGR